MPPEVPYYFRATAYDDEGDYVHALPDLDKALKLNPKFGDGFANRATTQMLLKHYAAAWSDVKHARELGGNIPPDLIKTLEGLSDKKDTGK